MILFVCLLAGIVTGYIITAELRARTDQRAWHDLSPICHIHDTTPPATGELEEAR
jgi:hypothetical protein